MKKYPIIIKQVGFLTNEELSQEGLLIANKDDYYVELIGDSVFYKFKDTKSGFFAILEIEKENSYDCFELELKEDYDLEDFEIIKDEEYKRMISFLHKEYLENCLANNKIKKISKKI